MSSFFSSYEQNKSLKKKDNCRDTSLQFPSEMVILLFSIKSGVVDILANSIRKVKPQTKCVQNNLHFKVSKNKTTEKKMSPIRTCLFTLCAFWGKHDHDEKCINIEVENQISLQRHHCCDFSFN